MKDLKQALLTQLSKLEALKTQGKALLSRGRVSMEDVNSYLGVADAVLDGVVPATLSTNVAIASEDPASKLELAVMEVDRMADATETEIGQVPPSDSVVSMSNDEDVLEFDTLIDESEEFTAISEFGSALAAAPEPISAPAFEHFKKVVLNCFKRVGVSFEDIEQIENANDIDTIISKVDDVRDVADSLIENVSGQAVEVSVESRGAFASEYNRIMMRAGTHTSISKARKETVNVKA